MVILKPSQEEPVMKGHSEDPTEKSTAERGPLTTEEILRRDNIPASEPIPADIAERFADKRIFLLSDEKDFDPRKNFTKVKGSKGTWVLSTTQPLVSGLPVEKVEQVEPGSMSRKGDKERSLSRGAEGSNPAPSSRESEISSAHRDNRVPQR
jgi:hypothetical protein